MSGSGIDIPTSGESDAVETAVAGMISTLVLLVGFGLLALNVSWFWIAFPIGFGGLLPAAIGLTRLYRDAKPTDHRTSEESALETLRQRYARGEIDEAAFERRLETLLETESADEAAAHAARESAGSRERSANEKG